MAGQHGEQMIMGIVETLGGCERIVKSTVPQSYSRHTSRFLRHAPRSLARSFARSLARSLTRSL